MMNKLNKLLRRSCLLLLIFSSQTVFGQKFTFSTNVLSWATLSPNIGVEAILSSHVSLDLNLTVHPFDYKSDPMQFVVVQPEVRYWLGRPQARHFFGLNAFYVDKNFTLNDDRYKGHGFGAGVSYGYSWVLSDHWNIEASLGVGIMRVRQFNFGKEESQPAEINYEKWLPVPSKCAVSFVYILK